MINKRDSLIGKLWSRALHLFFRANRGLTIGVRAVVTSQDRKFLLVRHTYTQGWHFPGGGVEPGETIEESVAKELREETGLELIRTPKFHGIFFNRSVSKHDHILVYLCETEGEIPVNPPSSEIAELNFYDIAQLPIGIDPGTERRLMEIAGERVPDEDW